MKIDILDPNGSVGFLRFDCLFPPFDNPAVRRAMLRGTNQQDAMIATVGDDPAYRCTPYGFFAPGSVMASDVGFDSFTPPLSPAATDLPVINAMSEVCGDMLRKAGITLGYVATDWGTATQRILKQDPPAQGGWTMMVSWTAGSAPVNPAAYNLVRGPGRSAIFGWPSIPELETLRNAWFEAPDEAAQARIGREMQKVVFKQMPHVPLGQFVSPTALRSDLEGRLRDVALFYGVRRV